MIKQIENILAELKAIQVKLPELRDLFWLKIDRYNETDKQRGVAFDEKFEQQRDKLFRAIDSFTAFIEKSFAPSAEDVAKEKALQKLRAEFPGFDEWNEEAKKALLEREMNGFLETYSKIADNSMESSKRIKEELQNLTILNGDDFSENFLNFYQNLDPTPSTHNAQKYIVRNYLLRQGYDEHLVNSLKKFILKSPPKKLIVKFPDGTEINDKYAANTLSETIKRIGIEKVIDLGIIVNKNPFISQDKDSFRSATFVENGYYVNTYSSTIAKKQQLDNISNCLNLNLIVEISER
jgi:hypothetical protein